MPRASATSLTLVLPKPRATTSRQVALRISSRRTLALPRVAYTSERVLAFEMERLFAGSWVCVARAEDLWDPGDQLAAQIGEVGVLVVRDRDASLRAFANVCRHRGHELLPGGASASARSV